MARLIREGDFGGPDFVRGLALQKEKVQVISESVAYIGPFEGGFDTSTMITMVIFGTGFGITADGRYTGRVSGFIAEDQNGNNWHVTDYGPTLSTLATAAVENTFVENLLGPTEWNYFGNDTPDIFIGAAFADKLRGFAGNDTFEALGGDDFIWGGKGKDTLRGQQGNDEIDGGRGNDKIYGGEGNDLIFGRNGDDRINGGADGDTIRGGDGDDVIKGNSGSDTIYGGDGFDTVNGGIGEDSIRGGKGDDRLLGNEGTDTIRGGTGKDIVNGGQGVDVVFGNANDDTVQGGIAADFIFGGRGNDIIAGNIAGTVSYDGAPDTFIFEGRFGHDVISDFEIGWDAIFLLDFDASDVTARTVGSDVLITAKSGTDHTILVRDVAADFNVASDIAFIESSVLDDIIGAT